MRLLSVCFEGKDNRTLLVSLPDQMNENISTAPSLPQRLSLVSQTAQSLRDGIRTGHWQEHLPGERELCAHLQVSRPTLRAALEELQRQGWIDVTRRQRRRIRASQAAQCQSAKREIAMLSANSFLAMPPPMMFVIDELRDKLAEAGYTLKLHVNRACFSAAPVRTLELLVRHNQAAVWLVFGSKEPMQRWFIRQQLPCLIAGSCAPDIALPSVDVDYRATCHHAGGLLLRKGHRSIALVLPKDAYGGDLVSEEGLREALASAQAPIQLRVLRHDDVTPNLCKMLDQILLSPNPPTAFLVARSPCVLTVMMHLMRRGKRIPQDVAVISRDNDPFLQATAPIVARYMINPGQIARRLSMAARQLAETGTMPAHAIRLIPKFVPGETV